MNKYRKLLMSFGLIACLLSFCQCSRVVCSLYTGDILCDVDHQAFNREEWHKYPFRGSKEEMDAFKEKYPNVSTQLDIMFNTRCIREAMICDLTQNVIPIGTTYEKVVALLGSEYGSSEYSYLYEKNKFNELPNEKNILAYTSGGDISGENHLVILFENGRISKFLRVVAS